MSIDTPKVRVGDRVRAVRQDYGTVVEDVVTYVRTGWVDTPVFRLLRDRWDITVIKPASNIPTEPGRYNVVWHTGEVSLNNPWTVHPDGKVSTRDGRPEVPSPHSKLPLATWTRIPDPVWQSSDVAILYGKAWKRTNNGYWLSLGWVSGGLVYCDTDMRDAKLIIRDGQAVV